MELESAPKNRSEGGKGREVEKKVSSSSHVPYLCLSVMNSNFMQTNLERAISERDIK